MLPLLVGSLLQISTINSHPRDFGNVFMTEARCVAGLADPMRHQNQVFCFHMGFEVFRLFHTHLKKNEKKKK